MRVGPVPRRTSQKSRGKSSSKGSPLSGITLETLEEIREHMPEEQFRQLLGSQYDELLAEERAKAITRITQTELGRRTRRWLDEVHAFLQGRSTNQPSSEVLCNWICFCYTLELHREATALLVYVHEDELDSAIYRQAKRIVEVSRSRATR